MGLDAQQLRDQVVRPVLARLGLPGGLAAEQLVMGTAAQESGLRYLHQIGGGPALGLWQMEPATFADLWDRFLLDSRRRDLRAKVVGLLAPWPSPLLQLATNLDFGAAMCRIHYFARPFTFPAAPTVEELGQIWKAAYNSPLGKGTAAEFVANYNRLVAPVYR